MELPTVVIGSDHGGYNTKQRVIKELAKHDYKVVDVGGFDPNEPDDYPDYAREVAHAVSSDKKKKTLGILICGTGSGMVIAANKVKGVRAAIAYDHYTAVMARKDDDANVLALRGRKFAQRKAAKIALAFLKEPFSGLERHKRRVRKVTALERAWK